MFCSLTILANLDARAPFTPLPSIAGFSDQSFFTTVPFRLVCHLLYLISKAQRSFACPTFIALHGSDFTAGGRLCEI
jgi:hypothetical protein